MANLVPLHVDKDTGRKIAKSGGANGPPGFLSVFGITHDQITPATVWTIVHNAETTCLLVQVYDENDELIVPEEIKIVDINTVVITFIENQVGRAHLLVFGP